MDRRNDLKNVTTDELAYAARQGERLKLTANHLSLDQFIEKLRRQPVAVLPRIIEAALAEMEVREALAPRFMQGMSGNLIEVPDKLPDSCAGLTTSEIERELSR